MPYVKHIHTARIDVEPYAFTDEVVRLYEDHGAVQKAVALALGVGEATLIRWIQLLDKRGTQIVRRLRDVKKRATREGWHAPGRGRRDVGSHVGGRRKVSAGCAKKK